MHFRDLTIVLLLLSTNFSYGQKKFKVVATETGRPSYSIVDEDGKLLRQLDTAKYFMCFNPDQYVHFAIVAMEGSSGWPAIDADEKILFEVYNTSFGEPSPDRLVENKIRIVDDRNLIGFANNKGQVIIKPQFEFATSFHKGKSIIGKSCEKVPWDEHADESNCHHFSIVCEKHGYINDQGAILKLGEFSFEQIVKEIEWKDPDK